MDECSHLLINCRVIKADCVTRIRHRAEQDEWVIILDEWLRQYFPVHMPAFVARSIHSRLHLAWLSRPEDSDKDCKAQSITQL